MTTPPPSAEHLSWLSGLRAIAMGVATAEIGYLIAWTCLYLLGAPTRIAPDLRGASLGTVSSLGEGMAWAALVGALAGMVLVTALSLCATPSPAAGVGRKAAAGRSRD